MATRPPDDSTALPDLSGIVPRFRDTFGQWKETPADVRAKLLESMGLSADGSAAGLPPAARVVLPGRRVRLAAPADVRLEDGTTLRGLRALPPDLPIGYHRLTPGDGAAETLLLKRPASCWLDPGMRTWGWAVQVYAARSRRSWGIGDLGDLRRLAGWSASAGAGALLINPLGAVAPVVPQQSSPYYAGSRRFRNPIYLDLDAVATRWGASDEVSSLAAEARLLNAERIIDRDRVFCLKMAALERIWKRVEPPGAFDEYCRAAGESLQVFGRYCALAEEEELGADWRSWPESLRNPAAAAVARRADERADRVRFHLWLQWLLAEQLREVSAVLPVVSDLPIGVDPGGVDAWQWQDALAQEVTVGAPPDLFNSLGQDWGLPPFIPHGLRAAGYQPFIETLQAAFQHAGGLRIDHVMGLFRLYWIPQGCGPQRGAYVRYPADELLAIVAIESHRARAWVAGEDLGTVERVVRNQLAKNAMLSYRLLWFESKLPAEYPRLSLAAVTTHDLPTIAGLWNGSDFQHQQQIGLSPSESGYRQIRRRLVRAAGVDAASAAEDVVVRAHAALAAAPSAIVVANLDDALATAERTNMPGTVDQWPNWSLAIPLPLEDLERSATANAVAAAISQGRSASGVAAAAG